MAATLAVVIVQRNWMTFEAVFTGGVVLALTICAIIDARTGTIPNRIIYPMLAFTLLVTLIHPERSFVAALVAAITAGVPFLLAFWYRPRRIGGMSAPPSRTDIRGVPNVAWAGGAGAAAMLIAGLGQGGQSTAGVVAGVLITGMAFGSLAFRFDRRRAVADTSREHLTQTRGMGGGDVKLALLMGLLSGVPGVLAALTMAVLGGAAAAVTIAVLRGKGPIDSGLPYGPFLACGAVAVLL